MFGFRQPQVPVLIRILDQQGAIQALFNLHAGTNVRVIPEQRGIEKLELVAEVATGRDRQLGDMAAIHVGRHLHAMPVDRGFLG